ncbi:hypothetical protein BKA07_003059 [Brevibacterium marinum]|uniref:Uncharacterized protein n=1 Tax=Brevibacterium marinum TaxID=418643 RepID=A0A846RV34_9MICO|nr:hypothetical protein [Brevibacterium marinum]NJC58024.1 hypothetical protein [Brevibacterium marinum]
MNGTAEAFINGARCLVTGALVIGVAYGILVIFQDGQILDTIIVSLADLTGHLPSWLSAVGTFFFQGVVSFIVPPGSGRAAPPTPIVSPLAEMIGVTQQTAGFPTRRRPWRPRLSHQWLLHGSPGLGPRSLDQMDALDAAVDCGSSDDCDQLNRFRSSH